MNVLLICLGGALLFAWPFLGLGLPAATPALAFVAAAVIAFALVERGARRLDTRGLALLAVLAAVDSGLRAVLVTGIGGFSPVFFLILCAGYVFGAGYGFLVGACALLASALATGGAGPWLPYQMVAAGWVGVAAGVAGWSRADPISRRDIAVLAFIGAVAGFGFGVAMDVWDWSLYRGAAGLGWSPGLSPAAALTRFTRFYMVTSFFYDGFRAVGNVAMVAVMGAPVLIALRRFRRRFAVTVLERAS